jgi:metacaspase-1
MTNVAKGMALTIGLNAVDPKHYSGWSGELVACEFDANDMAEIAKSRNFQIKTLLTKEATRANVINEISKAAKALKAGDMFMFSYSGHGGQVPDLNGDEVDDLDETICLYDSQLIDDELNAQFAKFAEGVRILFFSDSCHSGTVAKVAYLKSTGMISPQTRYRSMPIDIGMRVYRENKTFYDKILKDKSLMDAEDEVKASVLLISGCQDSQVSQDGDANGLFTSQLVYVWNHGSCKKNYRQFYKAIYNLMPPSQQPNYYRTGKIDPKFEKQQIFHI